MRREIIFILTVALSIMVGIRFATPVSSPPAVLDPKMEWTIEDSKAYAQDKLYDFKHKQWNCLNKLWTKESNWRPNAYNKINRSWVILYLQQIYYPLQSVGVFY
jgi:hypothetical protein